MNMNAEIAANVKRARKAAIRVPLHKPIVPTNSSGAEEVRAFWRREVLAKRRAQLFDGSATAAEARHAIDTKGRKRKPKAAPVKRAYDPLDHVHPRRKRSWLRAHPEVRAVA